ncbi:unnamed protein product [Clonostachys rosea f. rosea IK726]|uniref:Uncharacterized protein n=1 Tax=Clonostachys rosea f. rosea IK726 TaxID=1349383 RepID=A0ACA9ULP8_BIOOC|nr:unnamed protein product [Clonostachys rosea f. rosea IK726]
MTQAVKRACDACHRRKVKCDGVNPCRNCGQARLSCTYNAIPQKKGPKNTRAKGHQRTERDTTTNESVQNRINGGPCAPPTPGLAPTPGLLTSELVKECIAFFFDNLYPQLPILDRNSVEQQVLYVEQNRGAYCLLTSLCAFVMLQPGMNMPAGDPYNLDLFPGATIVSSQLLVEEAVKPERLGYQLLPLRMPYGLESHDHAWYYLREASTMIHLTGMHQEDHYMKLESVEASRRRRLFWLVYATER